MRLTSLLCYFLGYVRRETIPLMVQSCRTPCLLITDPCPISAIIPAPFRKKDHASIRSHPGCEQSVPPAEVKCLAVVPSLCFTSVFGAISSNLSKSFWILALSPKCPCHPSLVVFVCMHNKPTPSSVRCVVNAETRWSRSQENVQPSHTYRHGTVGKSRSPGICHPVVCMPGATALSLHAV